MTVIKSTASGRSYYLVPDGPIREKPVAEIDQLKENWPKFCSTLSKVSILI